MSRQPSEDPVRDHDVADEDAALMDGAAGATRKRPRTDDDEERIRADQQHEDNGHDDVAEEDRALLDDVAAMTAEFVVAVDGLRGALSAGHNVSLLARVVFFFAKNQPAPVKRGPRPQGGRAKEQVVTGAVILEDGTCVRIQGDMDWVEVAEPLLDPRNWGKVFYFEHLVVRPETLEDAEQPIFDRRARMYLEFAVDRRRQTWQTAIGAGEEHNGRVPQPRLSPIRAPMPMQRYGLLLVFVSGLCDKAASTHAVFNVLTAGGKTTYQIWSDPVDDRWLAAEDLVGKWLLVTDSVWFRNWISQGKFCTFRVVEADEFREEKAAIRLNRNAVLQPAAPAVAPKTSPAGASRATTTTTPGPGRRSDRAARATIRSGVGGVDDDRVGTAPRPRCRCDRAWVECAATV